MWKELVLVIDIVSLLRDLSRVGVSELRFSPAPWSLCDCGNPWCCVVLDANGVPVSAGSGEFRAEDRGNAVLMSLAPQLVDSLREFVDLLPEVANEASALLSPEVLSRCDGVVVRAGELLSRVTPVEPEAEFAVGWRDARIIRVFTSDDVLVMVRDAGLWLPVSEGPRVLAGVPWESGVVERSARRIEIVWVGEDELG